MDVETDVGKVSMDSPFYATYVAAPQEAPIVPVRVDPQVINASGEGNLTKPQALKVAIAEKKKTDAGKDTKEEEQKTASKSVDSKSANDDETIRKALAGELGKVKTANATLAAMNPCWPFTTCGNERGVNWYEANDEYKGNVINIQSGEQTDNTTYNISINNVDISQKIVGTGTNTVTVRIWNR